MQTLMLRVDFKFANMPAALYPSPVYSILNFESQTDGL